MKNKFLLCTLLTIICTKSFAWDGRVEGKVGIVEVSNTQDLSFRVFLDGLPSLCGNELSWAFLSKTNPNYDTLVSVLLTAKAANLSVTLYTNISSINGSEFCELGYVSVK